VPLPSLGSENEEGEKGEEPPAVVHIATTNATPEPLLAAAVLPVIVNSPCTMRNKRRSKNRERQRKSRNRGEKRRSRRLEPPSAATFGHHRHHQHREKQQLLSQKQKNSRGKGQRIESSREKEKRENKIDNCHQPLTLPPFPSAASGRPPRPASHHRHAR